MLVVSVRLQKQIVNYILVIPGLRKMSFYSIMVHPSIKLDHIIMGSQAHL